MIEYSRDGREETRGKAAAPHLQEGNDGTEVQQGFGLLGL